MSNTISDLKNEILNGDAVKVKELVKNAMNQRLAPLEKYLKRLFDLGWRMWGENLKHLRFFSRI